MTDNEKIMIAGCAAGAAAAAAPAVLGYIRATARRPISNGDFLRSENGSFISECGEPVILKGINLNDDLLYYSGDSSMKNRDVFLSLESRFGSYGAKELIKKYNESFVSPSDIKYLRKLGANCVRIPLRADILCKKETCKDDIDFDRLDFIVSKCKKAGIYVILELHSAPGFQNTDSACGKYDECRLFDSSKTGFEARNAAIRLWLQVAAHYRDEPAVAAYDLLNRPLNRVADWESKLDMLQKFYRRLYKAVRSVDGRHIMILQAANSLESLPSAGDFGDGNLAFGVYSHFHTSFETESLKRQIKSFQHVGIPFIVCKLRSDEDYSRALTSLNDIGVSWLAGDYKGRGLKSAYLFGGEAEKADLAADSYEAIGEKWSKPLDTKNFEENAEFAAALKEAFRYGSTSVELPEKRKKSKPKIKVRVGYNVVAGK